MANEEKIIKFYSETIFLHICFVVYQILYPNPRTIQFYEIDILKNLNQNNWNLGVL